MFQYSHIINEVGILIQATVYADLHHNSQINFGIWEL